LSLKKNHMRRAHRVQRLRRRRMGEDDDDDWGELCIHPNGLTADGWDKCKRGWRGLGPWGQEPCGGRGP
jgi:hypothetical protein